MSKFSLRLLLAMMLGVFALASCSDDGTTPPPPEQPDLTVKIDNLTRTELTFTVNSTTGVDYAYAIVPKGAFYTTAEAVFIHGEYAMMTNGTATITDLDFEGGKEYTLFVASRKINPYVYSELYSKDISTNLPYTEKATLEKIGLTDVTYHIEVPDGVAKMKHVVVKKADYEAIKSILAMYGGVNFSTYLKVFGHEITESATISLSKYSETSWQDPIHFHSGTDYYLLAGIVDDKGNIAEEDTQVVEFSTRRAGECPFDFNVTIETTSISAVANIVPDAGIESYRTASDTRTEFEYILTEGDASFRANIIGPWSDTSREHSGPSQLEITGLRPDTEYILGIVGFDKDLNEKVKTVYFTTGSPVGPKPEMEVTQTEHSTPAPWANAAVNIKAKNAVALTSGFFLKSAIDAKLAEGFSLLQLVQYNGVSSPAEEVQQALSPEGLTLEVKDLAPETEYIFAIVGTNEEYVSTVSSITFITEPMPQFGGEVRANMPGKYIASTTDATGAEVTFPVTISAGVNDATTSQYKNLNRLVCLGFGPADKFPFLSPEAIGGADANANYGPKWFIEFTQDGIIVPTAGFGADDLAWNSGVFDGNTTYFWAIGKRHSNGRDTDSSNLAFETEVSADGNTITVKSATNSFGNATYYPAMVAATSAWWFDDELFRCYSPVVLTRQPDNTSKTAPATLSVPRKYTIDLAQPKEKSARQTMSERLSK